MTAGPRCERRGPAIIVASSVGRASPFPIRRPVTAEPISPADPADRPDDRVARDLAVVDAVLGGDREAFRQLVERESGDVVRACARVLGDHAEAEDAAQEAFVTAYRALPTWRGDGPFGAWVVRIAVRIALRRAGRLKNVTWLDPGSSVAEIERPDRVRFGSPASPDPAGWLIRAERDTELRRAVAALDEPYREVVALRFFGERSLAEIAQATDRPLGTVKTHLHRGLARLRTALEDRA